MSHVNSLVTLLSKVSGTVKDAEDAFSCSLTVCNLEATFLAFAGTTPGSWYWRWTVSAWGTCWFPGPGILWFRTAGFLGRKLCTQVCHLCHNMALFIGAMNAPCIEGFSKMLLMYRQVRKGPHFADKQDLWLNLWETGLSLSRKNDTSWFKAKLKHWERFFFPSPGTFLQQKYWVLYVVQIYRLKPATNSCFILKGCMCLIMWHTTESYLTHRAPKFWYSRVNTRALFCWNWKSHLFGHATCQCVGSHNVASHMENILTICCCSSPAASANDLGNSMSHDSLGNDPTDQREPNPFRINWEDYGMSPSPGKKQRQPVGEDAQLRQIFSNSHPGQYSDALGAYELSQLPPSPHQVPALSVYEGNQQVPALQRVPADPRNMYYQQYLQESQRFSSKQLEGGVIVDEALPERISPEQKSPKPKPKPCMGPPPLRKNIDFLEKNKQQLHSPSKKTYGKIHTEKKENIAPQKKSNPAGRPPLPGKFQSQNPASANQGSPEVATPQVVSAEQLWRQRAQHLAHRKDEKASGKKKRTLRKFPQWEQSEWDQPGAEQTSTLCAANGAEKPGATACTSWADSFWSCCWSKQRHRESCHAHHGHRRWATGQRWHQPQADQPSEERSIGPSAAWGSTCWTLPVSANPSPIFCTRQCHAVSVASTNLPGVTAAITARCLSCYIPGASAATGVQTSFAPTAAAATAVSSPASAAATGMLTLTWLELPPQVECWGNQLGKVCKTLQRVQT